MIQQSRTLWCITLLSALAFNIAWLCEPVCAWLIVPSLLLLCLVKGRVKELAIAGLVWGMLVFSFHFHWLGIALLRHVWAHPVVLIPVIIVIIYFACVAALLFYMLGEAKKTSRFFAPILILLFFLYIDTIGLVPLGLGTRYPFFNPLIPLACYTKAPVVSQHYAHLIPVVNRAWNHDAPWSMSAYAVAERLRKCIADCTSSPSAVILAPESTFLFPLHEHVELLGRLTNYHVGDMLIGSILMHKSKCYQAVYHVKNSLIINFYVKKTMVPFVEQIPFAWRWLQPWLKQCAPTFCYCQAGDDTLGATFFNVQNIHVQPLLCYEFFTTPLVQDKKNIVMAFVNDSWYNALFRRWLLLLATLKSHVSGVAVVYIGHYGCYTIKS